MTPDKPGESSARSDEPSLTFRIPREQRYTLSAVLGTALTIIATVLGATWQAGIWYGSLNTKIDNIKETSDSNSADLRKIRDDLGTVQSNLSATKQEVDDLRESGRGGTPAGGGRNDGPSRMELNFPPGFQIPPIQVQGSTNSASTESQVLNELVDYKMAGELLKSEVTQPNPPNGGDADAVSKEKQYLIDQRGFLTSQLKTLEDQLEARTNKMPSGTRDRLKKLVDDELTTVECLKIGSEELPSTCPKKP
jgi:hypothetical protein